MANFLWGAGGAKLTPEEIALQRSVLARRKAAGVDTSPVGHWSQGLARVVDALGDRYQEGQLNDAATENATVNKDILAALFGGQTAPASPVGVGSNLSAPAASPIATDPVGEVLAAAPANNIQGNGEWLRYANQSATRNKPLDEKLVSALSFLPELGITAEVFSGGQDAEGPNRTGSRRHDHGGAGDFRFYKDGRQLDWSNPEDVPLFQQIVQKGKASGITGFGAGPGYMGQGTMHVGFGTPSVWGAGGKGDNAPEWLRQAYAGSNSGAVRQAATVATPQVAQAQNIAPTNILGVSPTVIQALTSPYANEQTKGVAKLLLEQQQGQSAQAQKLALAERQRQQEIARRQAVAQQTGIDPAYAADDDIWKAATGERFAAPSTSLVGANIIDNRTGQPIYQGTPEAPTSVREFEYGQQNPEYFDQQERLRRSGASMTEGAIPTGYQANRDGNGRIVSYAPIPGGPADTTKKADLAKTNTERSGNIVLEDVDRAVGAIESNPALTTGLIGNWTKGISGTPANKVQNLLQTVRANSAFDRLQQMREASPTGGALGAVSDSELGLLQNAIGSLEQSNDSDDLTYNLKRVQGIYEDIIYGKDEAKKIREKRKKVGGAAGPAKSGTRLKFNPATGELE